jgi:hypothetical protein
LFLFPVPFALFPFALFPFALFPFAIFAGLSAEVDEVDFWEGLAEEGGAEALEFFYGVGGVEGACGRSESRSRFPRCAAG